MNHAQSMKYPIGIQSFENIIREGWVYIDKTAYIPRLVDSAKVCFLSRPRRFGKSLLLSTMEAYFEGKKDLFRGLAVYEQDYDWTCYPVLRFDFSMAECSKPRSLSTFILNRLIEFEDRFGVEHLDNAGSVGERFGMLISRIYAKTGRQVVILIDEYDKGITEVMDNAEQQALNQEFLRNFYMQIKGQDRYIRFCMITGVARFRHLTIFSGLNNIYDISMLRDYADICGITQQELERHLTPAIQQLALSMGQSYTDTAAALKIKFYGYRFSRSESRVYNLFSLFSCFASRDLSDYWIMTGTSRIFLDYLSRSRFELGELLDYWVSESELGGLFSDDNPIPLLYQTGYLTIRDYDEGLYRLDFPNGEVRRALMYDLMPQYMGLTEQQTKNTLMHLRKKVMAQDIDGFMRDLQALIAATPYDNMEVHQVEKTYHLMVYLIFLMMGINTRSEMEVSGGRIDMVAETPHFVYVFEFKLNHSAAEALAQIEDRGYSLQWQPDGRPVYKIGVNFSSKTRTIEGWQWRRC